MISPQQRDALPAGAPSTAPAGRGAADRPAAIGRERARGGAPGAPRLVAYLYILPAFAFFCVFVLAPLGHTFWLSFFQWDGVNPAVWIGTQNYEDLVHDERVVTAFSHAAVLIIFYSFLPIVLALILTAALSRRPIRGLTFYRTAIFLPQVISTVVVGVIWRWIYLPDGPLNTILDGIGLDALSRPWLGDFGWALPAVGLIGTWVLTGLAVVLFLAGVQQIPGSLYDAARVDGAGPVREFFAVTLPGIRNVVAVVVTLTVIVALRTFDIIFVTTRGGPGTSTLVPGFEIYQNAFIEGEAGYAAAISAVLAMVILVLSLLILRVAERGEK